MDDEIKKMYNKVKHDLEPWREVVLLIHSLLVWEQPFFPGIIFAGVTLTYIILWWMNLSTLTLLASITVVITLLDFGYPMISKYIFKQENWTGNEEKLYEKVIEDLCYLLVSIGSQINDAFKARQERSTIYLVFVTLGAVAVGYIGASINNMFLFYVIFLSTALYPGLVAKGVIQNIRHKIIEVAGPYWQKIKPCKTGTHPAKTD